MSLLLTIAVIAVSLFAWVCLLKIVPDCLLSMFRYRLWRQRDALAAEIRSGVFDNDHAARQLLFRIECYIRLAPQLSPLHIWLMRISMMGVESEPWLDLSGLTDEEREFIEVRKRELERTLGNHVLFETPTGWGVVLMTFPIRILISLFRTRSKNGQGKRQRPSDEALRRASQASSELANRVRRPKGLTSQHV